MTQITASLVKELRERTGAGMMDCKKALTENNGDIEAAIDWLRTKGLAKAAKKAGRTAAEGLVGMVTSGTTGALVEVNSETDFVARNEQFQQMVSGIANLAADAAGSVEKLNAMTFPGTSQTVDEFVKETIATIGENMTLRRAAVVSVDKGLVAGYMHNKVDKDNEGLGKLGSLVALQTEGKTEALAELGRQLAMHVAATKPIALNIDGVPADVLEREKGILAEKNQGKPDHVLEKIFQSSLKSFAKEHCLLDQPSIYDTSKTVSQMVKEAEKDAGAPVELKDFVFFVLGEGVDKGEEEDFAEEVRKAGGA
ncbi:MAG: elongation factor Ts [Hyphomicrobiaceae bacterium]|nr:elongation factor Ts [Hyphomicrobiaceae bacterium]MCC0009995.1 elongation factor Ts [Hyphomicrobiaceae bacterium]